MYRRHKHAPATHVEDDFRNLLICPSDVVVSVGDDRGMLAMLYPKQSQNLRVGDFLWAGGSSYRLDDFVCSMGYHRDAVHIYRITEVQD